MYKRRQSSARRHLFVAVLVSAACVFNATAQEARAYHVKKEAPTYLTGHVLPQWDVRLGLDYLGFGLFPRVSVNTMLWGYLLWPITGDVAPNVTLRVGALRLDPFFLSVESGFIYVRLGDQTEQTLSEQLGQEVQTDFYSVPIVGAVSYHPFDALLVSADVSYFFSSAGARAGASLGDSRGVLASESLQVGSTLQYAFTDWFAVTFKFRIVAWTPTVPFSLTIEDAAPDSDLELVGNVRVSSLSDAYQLIPGVAFSWNVINLRLGVGYGHLFLPTLGLVSSYKGIVPDIEFYFRF